MLFLKTLIDMGYPRQLRSRDALLLTEEALSNQTVNQKSNNNSAFRCKSTILESSKDTNFATEMQNQRPSGTHSRIVMTNSNKADDQISYYNNRLNPYCAATEIDNDYNISGTHGSRRRSTRSRPVDTDTDLEEESGPVSSAGEPRRRSTRSRPVDSSRPLHIVWPGDDLEEIFGEPVELSDMKVIIANGTVTDDQVEFVSGSPHVIDAPRSCSEVHVPVVSTTNTAPMLSNATKPSISSSSDTSIRTSMTPLLSSRLKRRREQEVVNDENESAGRKKERILGNPTLSVNVDNALMGNSTLHKQEGFTRILMGSSGVIDNVSTAAFSLPPMGVCLPGSDYAEYEADSDDENFLRHLTDTHRDTRIVEGNPHKKTKILNASNKKKKTVKFAETLNSTSSATTSRISNTSDNTLGSLTNTLIPLPLFEEMITRLEIASEMALHWLPFQDESRRLKERCQQSLSRIPDLISSLSSTILQMQSSGNGVESTDIKMKSSSSDHATMKSKQQQKSMSSNSTSIRKSLEKSLKKLQSLKSDDAEVPSSTSCSARVVLRSQEDLLLHLPEAQAIAMLRPMLVAHRNSPGSSASESVATTATTTATTATATTGTATTATTDTTHKEGRVSTGNDTVGYVQAVECENSPHADSDEDSTLLRGVYLHWLHKRTQNRGSLLRCFHRHLLSGYAARDTVPPLLSNEDPYATSSAIPLSLLQAREHLLTVRMQADRALTLAESLKRREIIKAQLFDATRRDLENALTSGSQWDTVTFSATYNPDTALDGEQNKRSHNDRERRKTAVAVVTKNTHSPELRERKKRSYDSV